MVLCLKAWKSRSLPGLFLNNMNKYKCAVLVPARSGSVEIKNKNIIKFNKKSLLEFTLLQAKKSVLKQDIYVSSDSIKILNIAKKYGAYSIKRPQNISKSNSKLEPAIKHFIKSISMEYEYIMVLQPTSPLRRAKNINESLFEIIKQKKNSLISGSIYTDLTLWKENKKKLSPLNYNPNNRKPRQKSSNFFLENGSIYIFKTNMFRKKNNRIDTNSLCYYLMSKIQSFEVDTFQDFKMTEKLHKINYY